MKRRIIALVVVMTLAIGVMAQHNETVQVSSPDGQLSVEVVVKDGRPFYQVSLNGTTMIELSALGLKTSVGDFTRGLSISDSEQHLVDEHYTMRGTKASSAHYYGREAMITFENGEQRQMTLQLVVTNRDVAFRYLLQQKDDDIRSAVVFGEATAFRLPQGTTTFLSPQSKPMVGWMNTKPSYEEEYQADAPMAQRSAFGEGYTFPCLFHLHGADGTLSDTPYPIAPPLKGAGREKSDPGSSAGREKEGDGWVLISETGVDGSYAGSHLSDYDSGTGYTIAFPNSDEMRGIGSAYAGINLPGATPWRTITMGTTLQPIVETTITYDLVHPHYEAHTAYQPGRYVWSWLIWQDESINYDDQRQMVDLAAEMGYEYVLVDNWWDERIGRDRIADLSRYAQERGVRLMLWYNSNGYWNDAPQTPRNCMHTSSARQQEMAWMNSIGIAGIKVDFFGSDKQQMMQLYEDILAQANQYDLQVIFHGCTIPRGWERMFPNYVASEAVLASENVFFNPHHAQHEGFELTMHPFCRNALGAMDWGGIIMNRYMSRDNKSRHPRYTSDTFEMATGIVLQTSVNCVAMYPNNLEELPAFELDFLRQLPTSWDEMRYLDGYPTQYVALARRSGDQWYVGGLNATSSAKTLQLQLPMWAGKTVTCYADRKMKKGETVPTPQKTTLKVDKNGMATVTMQPLGGIILTLSTASE